MAIDRWLYVIRLRLRSLFRSRLVEQELQDEIAEHLEQRAAELRARGLSADEARAAAVRAFGGVEQRKEECRDARGVRLVDDVRKDLTYAVRMAVRFPVFTAAAVLSLALGIGASTAIFSWVDAVLLRPLPVKGPDALRVLSLATLFNGEIAKLNNTMPSG